MRHTNVPSLQILMSGLLVFAADPRVLRSESRFSEDPLEKSWLYSEPEVKTFEELQKRRKEFLTDHQWNQLLSMMLFSGIKSRPSSRGYIRLLERRSLDRLLANVGLPPVPTSAKSVDFNYHQRAGIVLRTDFLLSGNEFQAYLKKLKGATLALSGNLAKPISLELFELPDVSTRKSANWSDCPGNIKKGRYFKWLERADNGAHVSIYVDDEANRIYIRFHQTPAPPLDKRRGR